jgi:hypothetical protein
LLFVRFAAFCCNPREIEGEHPHPLNLFSALHSPVLIMGADPELCCFWFAFFLALLLFVATHVIAGEDLESADATGVAREVRAALTLFVLFCLCAIVNFMKCENQF